MRMEAPFYDCTQCTKSDSWDVKKAHESVMKKSQKSWFILHIRSGWEIFKATRRASFRTIFETEEYM